MVRLSLSLFPSSRSACLMAFVTVFIRTTIIVDWLQKRDVTDSRYTPGRAFSIGDVFDCGVQVLDFLFGMLRVGTVLLAENPVKGTLRRHRNYLLHDCIVTDLQAFEFKCVEVLVLGVSQMLDDSSGFRIHVLSHFFPKGLVAGNEAKCAVGYRKPRIVRFLCPIDDLTPFR